MPDFVEPDWNKPTNITELLSLVPRESRVKGVFFHSAINAARAVISPDLAGKKYQVLFNYPSADLIKVLAECAESLFPALPPRHALRSLGQRVFPSLKETAAGTLLYSLAGKSIMLAINLSSRAYKLFSTNSTAKVVSSDESEAIVELRNVWTFPDAYHVGIFEGAMTAYQQRGAITVRCHSPCDVDLKISLSK